MWQKGWEGIARKGCCLIIMLQNVKFCNVSFVCLIISRFGRMSLISEFPILFRVNDNIYIGSIV